MSTSIQPVSKLSDLTRQSLDSFFEVHPGFKTELHRDGTLSALKMRTLRDTLLRMPKGLSPKDATILAHIHTVLDL